MVGVDSSLSERKLMNCWMLAVLMRRKSVNAKNSAMLVSSLTLVMR